MPIVSSARERRLWTWAVVAVAAIFITLPLASTLYELVYVAGVPEVLFAAALLLVPTMIVLQGARLRPGGLEIGIGVGILLAYMLVFVRMSIPSERTHLMEYSVVAVLIYEALTERASRGRHVPVPAVSAFAATALIGAADEGIQWLLPARVFDWRDILFNVLAALMAISGISALGWARRRAAARRAGSGR